ncbi:MAG: hypothetical protein AMXMBFR64_10190 [Myxococcales bacterium]
MDEAINVLTIDVEDWFHLIDVPVPDFGPARWARLPSRVADGTHRLMDLLQDAGAGATFFVLGWVAERHPALVAEVRARGFEVCSHGWGHEPVPRLGRDAFEADLQRSVEAITAACGVRPAGYRAAGFSITSRTPWAFEVLVAHGFTHDSSVAPGRIGHEGWPTRRRAPFTLVTSCGDLVEFPLASVDFFGRPLSVGGGGYLRLLPGAVVRAAVRRINGRGEPATIYVHPRDLDTGQPRLQGLPLARTLRSYLNIGGTAAKLRALLRAFRFTSIAGFLSDPGRRAHIAAAREAA